MAFRRALGMGLVLIVAACGPCSTDKDGGRSFIADVGAERVLELMFPQGTPFAEVPVLKWDHHPTILVLTEDGVPELTRAQVDRELQQLKDRLPIASLKQVQLRENAPDLPSEVSASDIVLVIGNHAIDASRARYWPILRSAMDSDVEALEVASQAVANKEPVIQRFKVPFATGIVQRVVAMIRVKDNAIDSLPRISGVVYSSLCPSIGIHGRDKRLFGDDPLGPRITEEGYRYADLLYSDFVPTGLMRAELAKKIGATQ
jgi:hypothetical protein